MLIYVLCYSTAYYIRGRGRRGRPRRGPRGASPPGARSTHFSQDSIPFISIFQYRKECRILEHFSQYSNILPISFRPFGGMNIVAIFYPFSQFCEITISLLSLQKQPNAAPNLFQRGVEYGNYDEDRNEQQLKHVYMYIYIYIYIHLYIYTTIQYVLICSGSYIQQAPLGRARA